MISSIQISAGWFPLQHQQRPVQKLWITSRLDAEQNRPGIGLESILTLHNSPSVISIEYNYPTNSINFTKPRSTSLSYCPRLPKSAAVARWWLASLPKWGAQTLVFLKRNLRWRSSVTDGGVLSARLKPNGLSNPMDPMAIEVPKAWPWARPVTGEIHESRVTQWSAKQLVLIRGKTLSWGKLKV